MAGIEPASADSKASVPPVVQSLQPMPVSINSKGDLWILIVDLSYKDVFLNKNSL